MTDKKRIPSAGASITETEIELVTEAIRDGWQDKMSMHTDQLISEFSKYIGRKYCLPTAHCTDAIHLAMLALKLGPGDEVIVPDITWVASAAPITYVGATPVFVDVDKTNWGLSPEAFERAITEKTKAVVVVGLLGNMPDMDEIVGIAEKHKIAIIEDAAESLGATYKGKKAGTFGKISVFSFNATKLVMAGQGGLFVTDEEALYERAKLLAHHGINKKQGERYYWSHEIGYNYNWTNLQAALALAQFGRLEELLAMKKRVFGWYERELKELGGVQLNPTKEGVENTYWIVTAMVDSKYGVEKEQIIERAQHENVAIRPFFYPISSMPAYAEYVKGRKMEKLNPISYEISPHGICLPSAADITEEEVVRVCDTLKKILQEKP